MSAGPVLPDPLPEIREAEAPPETAAVYAALRQATGVPLVNLIWRHLATLPGVLPWAFAAVQPVLAGGCLASARGRLASALPLPALPPLEEAAWSAAGLAASERAPIRAVVETYNRGNLSNLILLTALRRALEAAPQAPAQAGDAREAAETSSDLPAIPPLPVLAALPPATQALVRALATRHGEGVIPSLYLHLAHWPALLAALPGWLGPVLARDALRARREAAVDLATAEAGRLRGSLALAAGPPAGQRPAVLAALRRFAGVVIPEMVPVGLALRHRLDMPAAVAKL